MITNEKQYHTTQTAIRRFQEALAQPDNEASEIDPIIRAAMRAGIESELAILQEQVAEYDRFRSGVVKEFHITSIEDLPDVLILARIASQLTQKGLAQELGVKAQQIQHYEATRYTSASFRRLAEIITALDLNVQVHVSLPDADTAQVSTAATLRLIEATPPPPAYGVIWNQLGLNITHGFTESSPLVPTDQSTTVPIKSYEYGLLNRVSTGVATYPIGA